MSIKKLGEITDSCLGKMLDAKKNRGTYKPYLANVNVRWGEFDTRNLPMMRFEDTEDERYGLRAGDLIVCEGGEPGRCAIWDDSISNMKIQKALHRVRAKDNVDIRYIYYWLLFAGKRHLLNSYFTGSTIKHLPGEKLKAIEIDVPSYEIQTKISDILEAFDRKIKTNNRINNNLQQQVQSIYQQLVGDASNNKMLLVSPNGVKVLPAKISKYEGEKIYIATADVSEHAITNKSTLLRYNERPSRANMQPVPWSLWFAKMKNSPKFIFINDKCSELVNNCIFSTGFFGLQAKRELFYYLWAFISSSEFDEIKDAYCSGTTMQALNNDGLEKISILLPSVEKLNTFADTVEPMFNTIHSNVLENEKLSAIRDALLPKLISGEIDVSNFNI